RPRSSTLRPYTTLFRSFARVQGIRHHRFYLGLRPGARRRNGFGQTQSRPVILAMDEISDFVLQDVVADAFRFADEQRGFGRQFRSEEHTSELQSRENLV